MSIGQKITTVEELAALPDGTIIQCDENCLWAYRYAGKRFKKMDAYGLWPLDEDRWMGKNYVASLGHFKDPLPATVIGFEEIRRISTDDFLGRVKK